MPASVAVPSAIARLKLTAVVLGLPRLTVNTANASVPSVTATLLTASAGVSLSAPPAPVPSSLIVPTPTAVAIVAFTGALSVTLKFSLSSKIPSFAIVTVIVWLITPGAKFTVPLVPV